ncbi:MAG: peptidase U32 family protein [Candidatus Woesearchaeota archaeon]
MNNQTPLILAPVNDYTTLKAAIDAGCDEIYFGIRNFNMRATAKNFTLKDLKKITAICHKNKIKAILALNIIIYDYETKNIKNIIKKAKNAKIDAIVAWDMSVISECVKQKMEVHLSTQNSISNYDALKMYKRNIPTLKRVVLARECTLDDITNIIKKINKDKLDVEIETFIHGAMCVSVSGRCMLSHHLFGKSANRGECLQPCRRNYKTYAIKSSDELDKDNEFELGSDCVISPKDLCTLSFIDKLINSGIHVFKIEGRNRNPEYVYNTVKAYKEVIDYYIKNKSKISKNENTRLEFEKLKEQNLEKLKRVFNRGFSNGFYMGKPVNDWSSSRTGEQTIMKLYVGKITNYFSKINVAEILIEDNTILTGDTITIQGSTTGHYELKVLEMKDDDGITSKAVKGTTIGLKVEKLVRKNDQVYKMVEKKN